MTAWNFYCENAVPFVQEYGLMSERLARTRLRGVSREIFEAKLALIHSAILDIRARRIQESMAASEKAGQGEAMTCADNT